MNNTKYKLGIIGSGNMAEALLRGVLKAEILKPEEVIASDPCTTRQAVFTQLGVATTSKNIEAGDCEIVLLAVKPHLIPEALKSIILKINQKTLIISIAAGVKIATISKMLPPETKIIRVMPNTPMLVNSGASALAIGEFVNDSDIDTALILFKAGGKAWVVTEEQLDAITAVSGSGPAYVFTFTEALTSAACSAGLPPELATELAASTVIGAAKLLEQSDESASVLRQKVTSPHGTTEAGLNSLSKSGFTKVITQAVLDAKQRSIELSKPKE
jgi:pyrroline-5-carboxylate reductase